MCIVHVVYACEYNCVLVGTLQILDDDDDDDDAGASENSQMLQSVLTQVSDHFNR